MPRFKLICDHSCDLDTHVVTHEFNAEYLPDVLMNIDMFLKGSGYSYDGEVTIDDYPQQIVRTPDMDITGLGDTHSKHYFDTGRNR